MFSVGRVQSAERTTKVGAARGSYALRSFPTSWLVPSVL
jgi:hypothetical protein